MRTSGSLLGPHCDSPCSHRSHLGVRHRQHPHIVRRSLTKWATYSKDKGNRLINSKRHLCYAEYYLVLASIVQLKRGHWKKRSHNYMIICCYIGNMFLKDKCALTQKTPIYGNLILYVRLKQLKVKGTLYTILDHTVVSKKMTSQSY